MTIFSNPPINSSSKIIRPKILYVSLLIALGMQSTPFAASAAFFERTDTDNTQYLLQEKSQGEINTTESMDAINELLKLEYAFNQDAIRLTKQGLEKLNAGDKQQGLKDLEASWKLERRLIPTGVMLALNYVQDKEYERAQKIGKEIQKLTTQKEYGLGYTIEGIVYAAKGELDKAETAFKQAIRRMPDEKNALLNLARLEEKKGHYTDAKTHLQTIVGIESTHLQALEQLAKIEFSLGNTEEATALLNKAINAHPDESGPIIILAQSYLKSGNNQNVLALTKNKTNPALLELRGKAYLSLGETESAEQIFENIVEQLPKSAAANYLLAEFFAKAGNIPEATKQIQNTLNKDPKFLPARIGEIKTLFFSGKTIEADQATQALIKEFGDKPEVLSIAGWLSSQKRDFSQAEKYFEKMARSNLDTELVLWWVNSLWAQNKYDPGFKIIKDWLKNHPDDISVQMAMADGYMGLQKKAEAKEAYLKIIEKQPKLTAAYNNLAWLVQETDLKQAIRYAEIAHDLEKENPLVTDTLGLLLIRDGQLDRGEALLKQATDKAPENAELLYHFAEVLMIRKKPTEAAPILEKLSSLKLSDTMRERVKALTTNTKNQ
ncbi:XrtA/PEP-CTERM system TPR-repeat protein PrsT [Methylomonas koyamae]|uniref:XrtA/PEP-CTERM system TPR-repeat protein PrsT n=1 Tax=Methylomonas koyamae TaxID=702114 RepID=UPI0028736818|nr:XrtA/PEP-CTERM system TPR-repeat protein PrsT [Methylomonas koyamae]WNB77255.1 PEP-CTERM system TPR-repeat protein PrsT [Methylomonas koyamae]